MGVQSGSVSLGNQPECRPGNSAPSNVKRRVYGDVTESDFLRYDDVIVNADTGPLGDWRFFQALVLMLPRNPYVKRESEDVSGFDSSFNDRQSSRKSISHTPNPTLPPPTHRVNRRIEEGRSRV